MNIKFSMKKNNPTQVAHIEPEWLAQFHWNKHLILL